MYWYLEVLRKYAVFNGRAHRTEYWMFFLCNTLIALLIAFVATLFGTPKLGKAISNIYALAVVVPGTAVGVRRMHDIGRSGWWLLLPLVNLVLCCRGSQASENRYGPPAPQKEVDALPVITVPTDKNAATTDLPPTKSDWPAQALKAGLILIVCIALKTVVTGTLGFDLTTRRDTPTSTTEEKSPAQPEITERATAPELSLSLASLSEQRYASLIEILRNTGHNVRCYGDLKRNEKLRPSITRICWTTARTAWGMPMESLSFHFGGDELQLIRMEFPNKEWPRLHQWYSELPGEDAGDFGRDDTGNTVIGKSVADGLLMTAKPAGGSTILVLWEAKTLFAFRCRPEDRSITDKQKETLCKGWAPPPIEEAIRLKPVGKSM